MMGHTLPLEVILGINNSIELTQQDQLRMIKRLKTLDGRLTRGREVPRASRRSHILHFCVFSLAVACYRCSCYSYSDGAGYSRVSDLTNPLSSKRSPPSFQGNNLVARGMSCEAISSTFPTLLSKRIGIREWSSIAFVILGACLWATRQLEGSKSVSYGSMSLK